MKITLKNYRCFPDSRPAEIEIRPGFTAVVGTNNSGKSALLKFFNEFRGLFGQLSSLDGNFTPALRGNPVAFSLSSIFDVSEVFCNANNRDLTLEFALSSPAESGLVPTQIVITVPRGTNNFTARILPTPPNMGNLRAVGTNLLSAHDDKIVVAEFAPFFSEFQTLSEAFYIGPFRNAINIGANENYFDIQVGQAFIRQWRALKTGDVKRNNELIVKVTEDIERIFDFERLQIDASNDEKTLQVFINKKSYKLPELGSGLTQFILVLGNAAIRNPTYVLIDEPELNLHPSLMLDFLTTLASYSRTGVVFGTHSIGLARAAADRIYSLRKMGEGDTHIAAYEATPRLSEFLGELSFSGYQELGGEKILLVEGPTDVKTVQQFLRLYGMDHKIVLLPLGGSTLINEVVGEQLGEIKRICPDILALIDSERSASGNPLASNRQGFVVACRDAGVSCHVMDRRAIENYFPDRAIKQAKGDAYRALEPFQALNAASPTWSKRENWRIAREMTLEDLNGTDLGNFLGDLCTYTPIPTAR